MWRVVSIVVSCGGDQRKENYCNSKPVAIVILLSFCLFFSFLFSPFVFCFILGLCLGLCDSGDERVIFSNWAERMKTKIRMRTQSWAANGQRTHMLWNSRTIAFVSDIHVNFISASTESHVECWTIHNTVLVCRLKWRNKCHCSEAFRMQKFDSFRVIARQFNYMWNTPVQSIRFSLSQV